MNWIKNLFRQKEFYFINGDFDIAITEKDLLKIGFIKTYDYNMAGDNFNILTYGNLKIWHRKDNYCCLFMQHTFKGLNELKNI